MARYRYYRRSNRYYSRRKGSDALGWLVIVVLLVAAGLWAFFAFVQVILFGLLIFPTYILGRMLVRGSHLLSNRPLKLIALSLMLLTWSFFFGLPIKTLQVKGLLTSHGWILDHQGPLLIKKINFFLMSHNIQLRLLKFFRFNMLELQIYFWLTPFWATLGILFSFKKSNKVKHPDAGIVPDPNVQINSFVNDRGYVYRTDVDQLEHRYIAESILLRKLNPTEIVHHINGQKDDNEVENLCVLSADKHELFHVWLQWKKSKTGFYPALHVQKRILTKEYGGILLSNVISIHKPANYLK